MSSYEPSESHHKKPERSISWYEKFQALPELEKFDFDGFPHDGDMRSVPVNGHEPERLAKCAAVACSEYNKDNGSDYRLTSLVKALAFNVYACPMYVTFLAHDAQTGTAKIFRCVCKYLWNGVVVLSKHVSND